MVWGHCLVMTLLYLTQGVAQGVSASASTYFLTHFPKDVSNATVATLGLPLYAFSLKFLWCPIIDGVFVGVRAKYRRLFWILPMQVVMACIFGLFALELGSGASWGTSVDSQFQEGFSLMSTEEKEAFFWRLTLAFSALAAAAAVQDVAVDGWAIEGLPSHQASLASSTQTVGLILGSTSTVMFLLVAPKYPEIVTLEKFMWAAALTSFSAIPISLGYAYFAGVPTLPSEEEDALLKATLWSHYKTVWKMVTQSKPFRRMILLTQTMNIAGATVSIMDTNLTRLGYFTTDQLVLLDLIHRALQITLAATVNSVIGKRGADQVLNQTLRLGPWLIFLALGGYFVTPLLMSPRASAAGDSSVTESGDLLSWVLGTLEINVWPPGWFAIIWLSQSLIIMISDSFSFTAACTLKATIATQHKGLSASAITVLNASANFGRKWPSTLALYAHGPLLMMLTRKNGGGDEGATNSTPTADGDSSSLWQSWIVAPLAAATEVIVTSSVSAVNAVFSGSDSLVGSISPPWVQAQLERGAKAFSTDPVYLLTLAYFGLGLVLMWLIVFPTLRTFRGLVLSSLKTKAD